MTSSLAVLCIIIVSEFQLHLRTPNEGGLNGVSHLKNAQKETSIPKSNVFVRTP